MCTSRIGLALLRLGHFLQSHYIVYTLWYIAPALENMRCLLISSCISVRTPGLETTENEPLNLPWMNT